MAQRRVADYPRAAAPGIALPIAVVPGLVRKSRRVSRTRDVTNAESANYCIAFQREACAVRKRARLRHLRAASISASVAPWLRAHISAADAEYLAT